MDKKPKYTLFPAKPSPPPLEPLPPLPEGCMPPPHLREPEPSPSPLPIQGASSPSTSPSREDLKSSSTPQAPLTPSAQESPTSPWPPLNNSWTLPKESEIPAEMHTPSSSTSSTSSLQKPPPTAQNPPSPPPNLRNRPRTVYFHTGLGGAGNYHKAIRENDVLRPMAGNRPNQPKFLSSLFGNLSGRRGRRQRQEYKGSDTSGSPQSSEQALPLGAAEVMRRKMLGIAGKSEV